MPGSVHVQERRRETMQSYQQRGPLSISTRIEFGTDAVMVRIEDFLRADVGFDTRYVFVARNACPLAQCRNGVRRSQRPVAVNYQPRIGLQKQTGIEPLSQAVRQTRYADIPCDVALQFRRGQT